MQLSVNRSSHPEVFVEKAFLEISQNSQESTCARVSFSIKFQAEACNFIQKETLAQLFSCEFCKISKNSFSYRTPPVAASGLMLISILFLRPTENECGNSK